LPTPDARSAIEAQQDDIVVVPKSDLGAGDFSAVTGEGLDDLITRITDILQERATHAGVAVRDRHRIAIERAVSSLGIAQDRLRNAPEMGELAAEDLRTAIRALDSLVGRVDVENLLDEIFASFCIGK
jgi:tRNA modification GTPase